MTLAEGRAAPRSGRPVLRPGAAAALRYQVGPAAVMRAHRARPVAVAGLPNVTLQVLPNTAGAQPGSAGTFSVLEFSEPHEPAVAYAERMTGSLFVDNDAEVHRGALAFSPLCAMALGPRESRAFVAGLAGPRDRRVPAVAAIHR